MCCLMPCSDGTRSCLVSCWLCAVHRNPSSALSCWLAPGVCVRPRRTQGTYAGIATVRTVGDLLATCGSCQVSHCNVGVLVCRVRPALVWSNNGTGLLSVGSRAL